MKHVTLESTNTEKLNKVFNIYDKSLAEITTIGYERFSDYWLVDLSSIFGIHFFSEFGFCDPTIIIPEQIPHINQLFNYIHNFRGIGDEFYKTVDRVTSPQLRVSDAELNEIYNDLQGFI